MIFREPQPHNYAVFPGPVLSKISSRCGSGPMLQEMRVGGDAGADHSRCPLSAYAVSLDMSDGRHDPRGGEKRSRLSTPTTGKRLISSPEYRVRSRYVAMHNKFLVVRTCRGTHHIFLPYARSWCLTLKNRTTLSLSLISYSIT